MGGVAGVFKSVGNITMVAGSLLLKSSQHLGNGGIVTLGKAFSFISSANCV